MTERSGDADDTDTARKSRTTDKGVRRRCPGGDSESESESGKNRKEAETTMDDGKQRWDGEAIARVIVTSADGGNAVSAGEERPRSSSRESGCKRGAKERRSAVDREPDAEPRTHAQRRGGE